jgi:hypothetical protein
MNTPREQIERYQELLQYSPLNPRDSKNKITRLKAEKEFENLYNILAPIIDLTRMF